MAIAMGFGMTVSGAFTILQIKQKVQKPIA
jgi:hypothetical protein